MKLNNSTSTSTAMENNFLTPSPGPIRKQPKGSSSSANKINPKEIAKQIPSSRLSLGMGQRVRDIVAIFPQGETDDPSRLKFIEHVNRPEKKIFSVSSSISVPGQSSRFVEHIGTEESAGDGYEYVLAFVDKKTGKAIDFQPTALINFQPRYNPSEEMLTGRKRKQPVDYSQNFSLTREDMRTERRRLTENFGNAKNKKMLEANIRRSITNETLMAGTTFSSTNILTSSKNEDEQNEDNLREKKPQTLSILEKGASNILPAPNYDAKVPADVYKIEQFLPKDYEGDATLRGQYEWEATKFFKEKDSFQKLAQSGVPPIIAKRVGQPLRYANPGRRSVLALKMVALAKFIRILLKGEKFGHVSSKEFDAMELPAQILGHLQSEYLGDAKPGGFAGLKMQVSDSERHRVLAELLCLLLLFDEPEFLLPISPLVQEFGAPEALLKKILTGIGCIIKVASETQAVTFNTVRIAYLSGPPKKESNFVVKKRVRTRKR